MVSLEKNNLNNMKKVAFCTHVSDDWYIPGGAEKLIQSAKHFHPEIPFYVFKSDVINELFKSDPSITWFTINPHISIKLADEYELVIHIDADSIIVDTLDELINGDFEVAGVRNNNDRGVAGAQNHPCLVQQKNGYIEPVVDALNYVNAGLIASRNKKFWQDWIDGNKKGATLYHQYEQDVLNKLISTNRYNFKLLDPINAPLYYGLASQYGDNGIHWKSWSNIKLLNDKLYLDGKKIKVLHQAGGSGVFPKLQLDNLFKTEISSHLKKICQKN